MVLLGLVVILFAAVYWTLEDGMFHRQAFSTSAAKLLVLEDCDSDFRTPPFEDAVITFGANAKPVRKVTGLNLCQTVGGHRSLSVANDGRFFTVCENAGQKLAAYQLDTGARLWSLNGQFASATISQNGATYALATGGPNPLYGQDILLIDQTGKIVRQAPVAGYDLVLDEKWSALWVVGKNIKKCDLELKVLREVNSIGWCAVSVDVSLDGLVWVAEREHPNLAQSTNRLLKVSPEGQVLKAVGLPFSPLCLRVDHSDGAVWVTGVAVQPSMIRQVLANTEKRTGRLPIGKSIRDFLARDHASYRTRKYDESGALQCELRRGGFTLDLDQANSSLWIGDKKKIYHYSRQGTFLGQASGLSADDKYVAIVPGHKEHKKHSPSNSR